MSRRYSRVFTLSALEKLVTLYFSKQRNFQTIWRTKLSHIFNSQIARQCLQNVLGTTERFLLRCAKGPAIIYRLGGGGGVGGFWAKHGKILPIPL